MNSKYKRVIGVAVLLAGYSALLAGLFGLRANPLIGVLLVLGGMALAICSATELVMGDSTPNSSSAGQ